MKNSFRVIAILVACCGVVTIAGCPKDPEIKSPLLNGPWTVVGLEDNPHLMIGDRIFITQESGTLYLSLREAAGANNARFEGIPNRIALTKVPEGWCAPLVRLPRVTARHDESLGAPSDHLYLLGIDPAGRLIIGESHTDKNSCTEIQSHGGRAHAEN